VTKTDDSRERILRAAEKIFAEKGLAGASVRAITSAAGVNHALINYYFGSKVALYQEVLERVSALIAAPRLRALESLRERYGEEPIPLRHLMNAYIRSFFDGYGEHESPAATWLRFYGRCYTEAEDEVRETTNRTGAPIRAEFLKELRRTLPELNQRQLVYRLGAVIGAYNFWRGSLGIMDDHLTEERSEFDLEELIDEVVEMSCAIFEVPPAEAGKSRRPAPRESPKSVSAITESDESEGERPLERSRRHRKVQPRKS
jgi:AcrR family transcriptional regulator